MKYLIKGGFTPIWFKDKFAQVLDMSNALLGRIGMGCRNLLTTLSFTDGHNL